jgi:hypothetical protein
VNISSPTALQYSLHKRRHLRFLRPSAAGHVEHLDVVLADEGCQSLAESLVLRGEKQEASGINCGIVSYLVKRLYSLCVCDL